MADFFDKITAITEFTPPEAFAGIDEYENMFVPAYAAALGTPTGSGHYRYAAVYPSGRLGLYTDQMGERLSDWQAQLILDFNPLTGRGIWSHSWSDTPGWAVRTAQDLLRQAGAPESVVSPNVPADFAEQGVRLDPHLGGPRSSAQVVIDTALRGLAYSRFMNYDYKEEVIPGMRRENYVAALGALVDRFGQTPVAEAACQVMDLHLQRLHTDDHTPGLYHRPHSDGRSERHESFMATASQAIRDTHAITWRMLPMHRVNFLSLFGDADFWAAAAQNHPEVFNRAVDHLQQLGPVEQTNYCVDTVVEPVALVRDYFPTAYAEITPHRPDFVSTSAAGLIIKNS